MAWRTPRNQLSPMKVAGKTGTALADEGPWTHGWFAGYAPAENPEIVLVVFLENGHGSDAAALASKIFGAFAEDHDSRWPTPQRGRSDEAAVRGCQLAAAAVACRLMLSPRSRQVRIGGFPQTVRVRLWYLHPPRELHVRAEAWSGTVAKVCNLQAGRSRHAGTARRWICDPD